MRYPRVKPHAAAVATVLGMFVVPVAAAAAPAPAPSTTATAVAQSDVHNGGVIEGKVTNVDYQSGVVTVDSTSQGRLDVATMPTTSVQSDDPGYHSLSDVSKGSKVRIFISKTAGKIVAQIIRLLKH